MWKERRLKKFAEKCLRIKDMLLNKELQDQEELRKVMKKELSKKEIEMAAMEYLVSLALSKSLTKQDNSNDDNKVSQTYQPHKMPEEDKVAYI